MSDCGCDKAKAELEEYLHRELSEPAFAEVADHLSHCTDCSDEHLVGLVLTEKVRKACQEKAPDDVRDAVLKRLHELA